MREAIDVYKSTLRRKYRHLRDNLASDKRHQAETIIADRVISSDEFSKCDALFTFVSAGSEVSTEVIIQKALETEKKLAVPLVTGKHDMCFIYINSPEELKEGKFGILEPAYDERNVAEPDENSLLLIPGLAFDATMNRLGYGGGYYDKYLSSHPEPFKLGICFHIQYTQVHLPHDPTDIPVDMFITENLVKRGV